MAKKSNQQSEHLEGVSPSVMKKLREDWMSAAQTKSVPDLEQDIILSVRSISQTTKDMKEDSKIMDLQNDLKNLKSGYTDLISEDKAKIEYIICLLNDRGIKVSRPKISTNTKE
jgi:hypothetical protein